MTTPPPQDDPLKATYPPTPCCNRNTPPSMDYPVFWNPFNKVVQCHDCGIVYSPKDTRHQPPESDKSGSKTPETDAVVKPFIGNNDFNNVAERDALLDFARTLELQRDEAKDKIVAMLHTATCFYCGEEVDRIAGAIAHHSLSCELHPIHSLDKVCQERDQFQLANEELRKDKERLDWLDSKPLYGNLADIWYNTPVDNNGITPTIRIAIDEAMAELNK